MKSEALHQNTPVPKFKKKKCNMNHNYDDRKTAEYEENALQRPDK